tara:strand:+ start:13 stop:426 length:414 start_codon:yes stop_codon:yes gene_type:complete
MKMNEIVTEEQLDEIIPAIAAGVARGAVAVGGAAVRGAGALARGAAKVGGAAARGAAKVGGAAARGVGNVAKAGAAELGQAAVSTVGTAMGGGAPGAEDKSPEAMRAKQEQKKAIQQSMADAKAQIAALQKELAAIR